MITEQRTRQVSKSGEFEERQFSLYTSPKAFKIVISNLYPDKVRAVLKELSANAYDAHCEVGTPKVPFEVTLPSIFEPTFILRDFGPAMSHEFMMNEYTMVFWSNRDTSNLFNGEKGLGRLTALSICDSYVCSCFQNGAKRTYSVYLNEKGVPSIVFLGEEETTEPNGFLIEIPVPENLCDEFQTKAKDIYKHYPTCPKFKNVLDTFKIPEENYLLLSPNGEWGIRGIDRPSMAIMSVYAYPIEPSFIPGLDNESQRILNSGLIAHFDLGELNTSTNRESLEYNETTINSLKAKLEKIKQEIEPLIVGYFAQKTRFEQVHMTVDLFTQNGKLHSISQLARPIIAKLKLVDGIDFGKCEVTLFTKTWRGAVKRKKVTRIEPSSKRLFYFCDTKKGLARRAKKHWEDYENSSDEFVFIYAKKDALLEFQKEYGFDLTTLPKASSLAYDPVVGSRNGAGRVKFLAFEDCGRRGRIHWEAVEFDPHGEVIYVQRNNKELVDGSEYALRDHISSVKRIIGREIQVIGLTKRQIRKAEPHWVKFEDFKNRVFADHSVLLNDQCEAFHYLSKNYKQFPDSLVSSLTIPQSSVLYSVYEEYRALKKLADQVTDQVYNEWAKKRKPTQSQWQYGTATIIAKYPILMGIETWGLEKYVIAALNEYIK